MCRTKRRWLSHTRVRWPKLQSAETYDRWRQVQRNGQHWREFLADAAELYPDSVRVAIGGPVILNAAATMATPPARTQRARPEYLQPTGPRAEWSSHRPELAVKVNAALVHPRQCSWCSSAAAFYTDENQRKTVRVGSRSSHRCGICRLRGGGEVFLCVSSFNDPAKWPDSCFVQFHVASDDARREQALKLTAIRN